MVKKDIIFKIAQKELNIYIIETKNLKEAMIMQVKDIVENGEDPEVIVEARVEAIQVQEVDKEGVNLIEEDQEDLEIGEEVNQVQGKKDLEIEKEEAIQAGDQENQKIVEANQIEYLKDLEIKEVIQIVS